MIYICMYMNMYVHVYVYVYARIYIYIYMCCSVSHVICCSILCTLLWLDSTMTQYTVYIVYYIVQQLQHVQSMVRSAVAFTHMSLWYMVCRVCRVVMHVATFTATLNNYNAIDVYPKHIHMNTHIYTRANTLCDVSHPMPQAQWSISYMS